MKVESTTGVVKVNLETSLNSEALTEATIELPKHGEPGLFALRTLRALGAAVEGLEGAVCTLKLSVEAVGDRGLHMLAEVALDRQSDQGPSDSLLSQSIWIIRKECGLRPGVVRDLEQRLGITTLGVLITKKADDLLELRNFGVQSLDKVRQFLAKNNLGLLGE